MTQPTPDMAARLAQAMEWIQKTKDEEPEELRTRMQHVADKFLGEVDGLSESQCSFSPGENEWSVRQVCLHMANAARNVGQLVPILASGNTIENPDLRLGVLDDDPGSLNAVLDSLEAAFHIAAEAAKALENNPNLDTRLQHPYFGPLNCRQWMAFNIMHTNVHVRQLQRIKNDENFPAD